MCPAKLGYVLWECEGKMIRAMAVLILRSCVEVKHCILSFYYPTRSHVKPIYLAGGRLFFFLVRCGARSAQGF